MDDTDTDAIGGESLTIDQAAAAFVKATTPNEADTGQSEDVEETEDGTTTDDELQTSDEDEGEESDGEDDPEGQAEDEEDGEEPESDQGRFVASNGKVRLPDGSVSTVADLIAGNMKERDYRQKTMELAPLKKEVEAQSAALKASQEQHEKDRELVVTLLKNIIPPPPDPAKADPRSDKYDPAGYQAEAVAHQEWAQYLSKLEADQQQSEKDRQAKADEERKGRVEKEWSAALEKMPELKDAKKLDAFGQKTLKFGAEYGYTPQELAMIHHDHRQLLVMRDAIKWRELQASKGNVHKKVENKPAVLKGGKRLNPSESKARSATDAITRLKQSGSVEDAAAAYIASLNKG